MREVSCVAGRDEGAGFGAELHQQRHDARRRRRERRRQALKSEHQGPQREPQHRRHPRRAEPPRHHHRLPDQHRYSIDACMHVRSSELVTSADLTRACAGDDCVSVSSGALDVNISRIRCGPGHGLRLMDYMLQRN